MLIQRGSIGHSCLDCSKILITQTTERNSIDLTKFKRPEIINPYICTYACSIDKIYCDSKNWICENMEERDWKEVLNIEDIKEKQLKLNDSNFNNLSGELQNMLLGDK